MRTIDWLQRTLFAWFLLFFALFSGTALGQDDGTKKDDGIKPVPLMVNYANYFTRVTGGQVQDNPSFNPLLLVPLGDKWLIEAKGSYSDTFARNSKGDYEGTMSYGLAYAQVDYIANRFVTLAGGRFITPFGMYGERFAPSWIRALQTNPLISPIFSGSSLGGMLRGGFPAGTDKVNLNYAFYFSTANTNHILATDRTTGGRIGFFLPGPRLEIGGSFQQLLQADRSHSAGLHAEWQPNPLPLTLRSEYVHSSGLKGSGYWIESVYRLSQIPTLRRLEVAGRAQQFFADPKLTKAAAGKLGALGRDTNQADFGLNYYFNSDVRASATYGRQFALNKNANLWVIGITYRLFTPIGSTGGTL
jgi:hypothetical protein